MLVYKAFKMLHSLSQLLLCLLSFLGKGCKIQVLTQPMPIPNLENDSSLDVREFLIKSRRTLFLRY